MRTRAWCLFSALLLLLLPGKAVFAADAVPDAAAIREKVRAAAGPAAASYREIDETVASNGLTTVEHDFRRGTDFRYTFDSGRFHTERGSSNGQVWHMNDNGQVIIDEPDPGLATRETTTTTVAAVHTPVEGYMIATLNVQSHGTKDYVDAATWHVVRREQVTANGTIVTTLDDFRADHGRTFAHHQHVENGYARRAAICASRSTFPTRPVRTRSRSPSRGARWWSFRPERRPSICR